MDLTRPANAPRAAAPARPGGQPPPGRLRPKPTAAPERDEASSWWTSRATAGEVTTGFTREAVTAEAKLDPAATDGLFERLGQVLGQLVQGLIG
jgi:hypothetical protein